MNDRPRPSVAPFVAQVASHRWSVRRWASRAWSLLATGHQDGRRCESVLQWPSLKGLCKCTWQKPSNIHLTHDGQDKFDFCLTPILSWVQWPLCITKNSVAFCFDLQKPPKACSWVQWVLGLRFRMRATSGPHVSHDKQSHADSKTNKRPEVAWVISLDMSVLFQASHWSSCSRTPRKLQILTLSAFQGSTLRRCMASRVTGQEMVLGESEWEAQK